MTATTSITFAVDYETAGGRTYKAGSTHKVNAPEARVLVKIGKARIAGDEPTNDVPAPDAVPGTPPADTAGDGTTSTAKKGK